MVELWTTGGRNPVPVDICMWTLLLNVTGGLYSVYISVSQPGVGFFPSRVVQGMCIVMVYV